MEPALLPIEDGDVEHLGVEQLAQPVADEVAHRLDVDPRRQALLDARDDRELRRALVGALEQPLRLVEQAGVLERDAQAGGERREDAHVGVAERALVIQVLEGDDPERLVAHDERHPQAGLRELALHRDAGLAELLAPLGHALVDEQGLARLRDVPPEADERDHLLGEAHASLDEIREPDRVRRAVDDRDVDDLGVEHVAQLVADEVVHRLEIDLRGKPLLDAVDDLELRGSLVRLGEQALGRVDQAGVLERDGKAACKRRQQAHVRVREGLLAIVVGEQQDAPDLTAADHRDEQRRLRQLALDDGRLPGLRGEIRRSRFTRTGARVSTTWPPEPDDVERAVLVANAALDRVREVEPALVGDRGSRCPPPGHRTPPGACPRRGRTWPACRSRAARPCWTPLMIASSAARSSASARRRLVASIRRAFSRETLRLDARVVSSRTSPSLKANSRSRFWSEITPVDRRPRRAVPRASTAAPRRSARPSRPSRCRRSMARSFTSSGSRVSMTWRRTPNSSIGSSGNRTPRSIVYGKCISPSSRSRIADVEHLGVEHVAQPVADQVVHRLHVDLRGEALLDVVDDRELGGPLVGLLEQPLRLVEQARVLERHAHARGERGEDALVGFRVDVLQRRLERQDPDHAVRAGDGDAEPRQGHGPAHLDRARRCCSAIVPTRIGRPGRAPATSSRAPADGDRGGRPRPRPGRTATTACS